MKTEASLATKASLQASDGATRRASPEPGGVTATSEPGVEADATAFSLLEGRTLGEGGVAAGGRSRDLNSPTGRSP